MQMDAYIYRENDCWYIYVMHHIRQP